MHNVITHEEEKVISLTEKKNNNQIKISDQNNHTLSPSQEKKAAIDLYCMLVSAIAFLFYYFCYEHSARALVSPMLDLSATELARYSQCQQWVYRWNGIQSHLRPLHVGLQEKVKPN